jgi:hypothetical protein
VYVIVFGFRRFLFVAKTRQELHADSANNGWAPNHAARLTGVGMVRLCREFAGVDMAAATKRTPN